MDCSVTFSKLEGAAISFEPCPFCGGKPEWVTVPGEDFIMRCSQCHASTRRARMEPETAAADWNRGEINDDHFSITSDTKIDDYLIPGIKKVLFSGYWFDEFPAIGNGFLCSEAVIVTDDRILFVDPCRNRLLYDELGGYSPEEYCKPITDIAESIRFKRSSWNGKDLTAIEFQCGETTVVISADEENQCMAVTMVSGSSDDDLQEERRP